MPPNMVAGMKFLLPGILFEISLLSAAATGAAPTAADRARQILQEDGFWDVASTTGFYRHRSPPDQLPLEQLQAAGVRGAMLGIGTLTDIYGVHSTVGWEFKEVTPGLTL